MKVQATLTFIQSKFRLDSRDVPFNPMHNNLDIAIRNKEKMGGKKEKEKL